MTSNIDYAAASAPPEKDPMEYSYVERRAEILEAILQRGYPGDFNHSKMGRRYDVSPNQISEDFDRLAEYYEDNIGENRELVSEAVYRKAIKGLLDEGEYRKAAQTVTDWNDWIDQRTEVAELDDRIDDLEDIVDQVVDNDTNGGPASGAKVDTPLE